MAAVLLILFVLVPILEIWVILQVGQVIGGWPTVALLLADSLLGAWLVSREGRRTWIALRTAVGSGQLPGRHLADAALILVGGTLLLTPGFVTDAVGFLLVLPPTRPLARRLLISVLARRVRLVTGGVGGPAAWQSASRPYGQPGSRSDGGAGDGNGHAGVKDHDVVRGEVVDPPDAGAEPPRDRPGADG